MYTTPVLLQGPFSATIMANVNSSSLQAWPNQPLPYLSTYLVLQVLTWRETLGSGSDWKAVYRADPLARRQARMAGVTWPWSHAPHRGGSRIMSARYIGG